MERVILPSGSGPFLPRFNPDAASRVIHHIHQSICVTAAKRPGVGWGFICSLVMMNTGRWRGDLPLNVNHGGWRRILIFFQTHVLWTTTLENNTGFNRGFGSVLSHVGWKLKRFLDSSQNKVNVLLLHRHLSSVVNILLLFHLYMSSVHSRVTCSGKTEEWRICS